MVSMVIPNLSQSDNLFTKIPTLRNKENLFIPHDIKCSSKWVYILFVDVCECVTIPLLLHCWFWPPGWLFHRWCSQQHLWPIPSCAGGPCGNWTKKLKLILHVRWLNNNFANRHIVQGKITNSIVTHLIVRKNYIKLFVYRNFKRERLFLLNCITPMIIFSKTTLPLFCYSIFCYLRGYKGPVSV